MGSFLVISTLIAAGAILVLIEQVVACTLGWRPCRHHATLSEPVAPRAWVRGARRP